MPSSPALAASPALADAAMNCLRVTPDVLRPVPSGIVIDLSSSDCMMCSSPLCLVDLLELALGPAHGILGLRALDGLGVHVHDDVLRVGLRRLARCRARIP